MVRTQMSLTPEQHARLQEIAQQSDRSMSSWMREAIDDLLARLEGDKWSVLDEVPVFRSGLGDVAENHDDYLYGPVLDQ